VDTWRVGPAALQVFLFILYDHSITMLSSKNTGSMLIINPKKWSMLLSSTIAYCGKLDNILLFFWQLFFYFHDFICICYSTVNGERNLAWQKIGGGWGEETFDLKVGFFWKKFIGMQCITFLLEPQVWSFCLGKKSISKSNKYSWGSYFCSFTFWFSYK
jgi:hypothetical protein